MKLRQVPLHSLALSVLLASGAAAQQVVLDFEDLTGFAPIPAGYGGIADWGSWAASDTVDPNYPPASGLVRIFSVGLQQPIDFGQDVVFDGANVVSALPFAWKLYYQGQLVHTSQQLQPNTGGPAVWLASGYTGLVDSMEYESPVNVHAVDDFTYTVPNGPLGMTYCNPAAPNSTGASGAITAAGSAVVTDNDVTLTASDLPNNAFGYFLTSQMQGLVMNPGGSQGNLCLGGTIGRYVGPGQIKNTGTVGMFDLDVDLTLIPQPTGFVMAAAGETWNFTAWHRDAIGGSATSNFTDAVSITFQ